VLKILPLQLVCHILLKISVRSNRMTNGRATAQAVGRQLLTAEARVRFRVSPCGFCGGQSDTGTGCSPSASVFPCQFHSNGAPLQGKTKKKTLSQGCTISLKPAVRP
jgi:hypothetical protein